MPHDQPRPTARRTQRLEPRSTRDPGDTTDVADGPDATALPADAESSYGAAPGPRPDDRRPDRGGAIPLTLTEPETVPITAHQHRQAVTVLSAMIVSWVQRDPDAPHSVDPS